MKFKQNRAKFKKLMFDKHHITNMFVAQDALSAKIAEDLGYEAIFVAGYATSASDLSLPDRGIADFDTMLNKCREIINATNLPVFADADTGYGDLANVARTVKNYEAIGAAGIFLEDQQWPKRCGHMDGKRIEPVDVLAAKIKTAVTTRKHDDFLIMSRTDARAVEGLQAATDRSQIYKMAGADLIFIEAPESIAELKAIHTAFPDTPLMANMIENGKTPDLTPTELQQLGFSLVVHPTASVYTEMAAMKKMLTTLKETGSTKSLKDEMITFPEFNHLMGLEKLNDFETKYNTENMQKQLTAWGI
ncbi:isocitrate lyase/PEP mutase family protein [Fructilactobacillus frigidiflavus]|uniref:isocitrate lyase/PEP mutase family protein n=1 Tax=Fructilactobacillus frigidiflavus TaxID=3242688 RepID=UPI0037578346